MTAALVLGLAALSTAGPGPARAGEVGTDDFAISDVGDGAAEPHRFDAKRPAIAYNTTDANYLVVWDGDDNVPPLVDGELEIFGQLTAADGTVVKNDFRISRMGPDGDLTGPFAMSPAVAYAPTPNEFLVVWSGDDTVNVFPPTVEQDAEIYAQRIDGASGALVGSRIQVSTMGEPDGTGGVLRGFASNPSVAHNATSQEWFVVWQGYDTGRSFGGTFPVESLEQDVYAQRLDSTGAEVGPDDLRLSDMGPDGETASGLPIGEDYDAYSPDVAWNSVRNEYAVVWYGDDTEGLLIEDEFEIFAQRVAADGSELGTNDRRISQMGPASVDLDKYDAGLPAIAFNPDRDEYLTVFSGETLGGGLGVDPDLGDGEVEIFGQRLAFDLTQVGTNDFRISVVGPLIDPDDADARYPDVAYDPVEMEYLVVWSADDPPLADNHPEIFGQRLTGTGTQIGHDDFRLSAMAPDADTTVWTEQPAVAAGTSWMTVWQFTSDAGTFPDVSRHSIHGQKWANEAPMPTSMFGPVSVLEDAGDTNIPLAGSFTDPDADAMTYAATSSAPSIVAVTVGGSTLTLDYQPDAYGGGITVSVTATDTGGRTSTAATIPVTVDPVNDPPTFTGGPDQTWPQDGGARTVTGWVTDISPGPMEASQQVTFGMTNDNNALFSTQPAVDAAGTLTFTPAPGAAGVANLTYQAMDDGGTANGGVDTSAPATARITIVPTVGVSVRYVMAQSDTAAVTALQNMSAELTATPTAPVDCVTSPVDTTGAPTKTLDCQVETGSTFEPGLSDLHDDYYVSSVSCFPAMVNGEMNRSVGSGPYGPVGEVPWNCTVYIQEKPGLYIDKIVDGGPAATTDFTFQIADSTGTPIGTVVDPSAATCTDVDLDPTKCGEIKLTPDAEYQLTEITANSYEFVEITCDSSFAESMPVTGTSLPFTFRHSSNDLDRTLCRVTNSYRTRPVALDLVIVNDDGGTATVDDFTLEVFQGTTLVASGKDPELGAGPGNASLIVNLPYGDYTFGVSGPPGYSASVVVTPVTAAKGIPGGEFTVSRSSTANGVVTVDDPPPPPTTTTTTTTTTTVPPTTVPPTTAPPTTAAPTTTAPPPVTTAAPPTTPVPAVAPVVPVLPSTGTSSSPIGVLLVALGAIVVGLGSMLLVRRR